MRIQTFLLFLVLPLFLAACASRTVVESDLGIRGAPDWVNEGSMALNDHDGRLLHGVGQASPMDDPSLQNSVADGRARAEIARVLGTFVDLAADDYVNSYAGGEERLTRQAVSQQLRNSTRTNLSGARIIARWKDRRSGVVYSLAELDLKLVKASLSLATEMNEDVKRHLNENSDTIFDRLVRENKQ